MEEKDNVMGTAQAPSLRTQDGEQALKLAIVDALVRDVGQFISGSALSAQLGVSRSALWKQIESLREMGYPIEAMPRRGYRLRSVPDVLFPWEVQRHMEPGALGSPLLWFAEVGSTNDLVREKAEAGAPEGLVIVAEKQVKGRGRRGRQWQSPDGGLWFTLLLRPRFSPAKAPFLTLISACAVVEALQLLYGLHAMVKWPNDLLVNGKKAMGALVEISADLENFRYAAVGIGLNVNMSLADLGPDVAETATTLRDELGRTVPRAPLLAAILNAFTKRYRQFHVDGGADLLDEACLYSATLGKPVTVVEMNRTWTGFAEAIAPDGALMVRLADGMVRTVYAADVSIRTN